MCGIAGYLGTIPPSDEAIGGALQTMKQRGPDHQGALRINLCDGSQAVLLSSRLSIVDLEARSNMPFQRDGWTIVFNGEIYNHEALRLELMREGVRFITSSDTEVLVAGLARFGQAFLDRAEGMWAFAAFDHDRQELMLCRDRFGEKPLFTYKTAHGFFFASEHKTIAALSTTQLVPNKRQVLRYLVNGYRSLHKSDETWHNGVLAFPPRTCRVTGVGGNVKSHRYWQLQAARVNIDEFEAVEHLKRLLPEAVRLRLRADVPIACCLSGGVDSTSLASLAVKAIGVKLHGFSIVDRNPHYDERENIEAVVKDLNCQSTFIEIPNEPFLERLKDLIAYHDGPLATISYYIHSFLAQSISEAGYRVALSGTGSDEIFTGYYDHYLMHLAELDGKVELEPARQSWLRHIEPIVRNPLLKEWDLFIRDPGYRGHLFTRSTAVINALREPFEEEFTEYDFGRSLLKNRMLNELFHEVVPPILHEDDLNSMRYSVENRSPFLDRTLVEFCNSLPSDYFIVDGFQKNLLRRAMDGVLVDTVRLNRRKVGFNASISTLLQRDSLATREVLLESNPLFDLVDPSVMGMLLDKPELTNQESQLLFSLINVSIFLAQS